MRAAKMFGLAFLAGCCSPLNVEAGGPSHCERCYGYSAGAARSADYGRSASYNDGIVRSTGLPRYYVVRDSLADRALYSGRTVDETAREAARNEFERLELQRRSAEEGGADERSLSDTIMAALLERLVAKLLEGPGAAPPPADPNTAGEAGPAPSPGAALKQRTERLAADVKYRKKQLEDELKILQSIDVKVLPGTPE